MPTNRSYGDACGIARALDVIGERWALLIVRELLFGPRRFTDLRRSLPAASSNIVADRLRELERHDVVRRRTLPPPAASSVYELTDHGRDLEPIVLALGGWGLRFPLPPAPHPLSAVSVLLFLRGSARLDADAPPATYRLELDGSVWTVRTAAGEMQVQPGEPAASDVAVRTSTTTLNALIGDPAALDAALADEAVVATGAEATLRRLLQATASPGSS
ncbi:MAG: winged helix-turn-helix transcriptional regulator [Acidimicrobiales bacterium]